MLVEMPSGNYTDCTYDEYKTLYYNYNDDTFSCLPYRQLADHSRQYTEERDNINRRKTVHALITSLYLRLLRYDIYLSRYKI